MSWMCRELVDWPRSVSITCAACIFCSKSIVRRWVVCMRQEQAWAAAVAQGAAQLAAATGAEGRGAAWLADELLRPWEGQLTRWPLHVAADAPQTCGACATKGDFMAQALDAAGRDTATRSSTTEAGPVEGRPVVATHSAAGSGSAAAAWRAMAALLAALGQALGLEALPSAWIFAELLAAAEAEPALCAAGAHAAQFLVERDCHDADHAALVQDTLARLLQAAMAAPEAKPCTGTNQPSADCPRTAGTPAVVALCSLLRAQLDGPPAAVAATRAFCREHIFARPGEHVAPGEGARGRPVPQAVLLRVTPGVAAAVRAGDSAAAALQESGLGAFAEAQLAAAQALPPVVSALADAPARVPACLASLRLVAACFPVPCGGPYEGTGPPGAATAAERAGLAWLLQRQLAGERAAGAAAAAAKRLQLPGAAGAPPTRAGGGAAALEAEGALAALAVCALAWAWDELAPADREAVARRVRDGLAAAAVALEDAAEAAAGAAAAAAARLASAARPGAGLEGGGAGAVAPDLALAMLRRAGRTGSAHAARAFQAAVVDVEAAVARGAVGSSAPSPDPEHGHMSVPAANGLPAGLDTSPRQSPVPNPAPLAGAPQDWARSLALLLAAGILAASSSAPSPAPAPGARPAGAREGAEALGEALRLLFAGGVLAAVASAAGPGQGVQ